MAHCTGRLCPFEEQEKFINVKKVPESLQVCSIFRNTVRCWRKNVPILSLCLSPIPPPFSFLPFSSLSPSFTVMLSPFFNCFFCNFFLCYLSLSFYSVSLSPSPSVYFLLYSSSHIAWMPLSHPPPLRTHASWGILIGWSFKESSVGEWVAVWLEGVRQTARRLCSNAGAPSLSPREFLKWASALFLFPSHSNHSDSWECFTVVTSVLSNLSSCTPLPTCP